jgi:hypothetical protein
MGLDKLWNAFYNSFPMRSRVGFNISTAQKPSISGKPEHMHSFVCLSAFYFRKCFNSRLSMQCGDIITAG